jgi:hypothetical protein
VLRRFLFLLLVCVHHLGAYSTERYPVDVCFMIADLKYSAERGVKICEIQHGSLSKFKGDKFRNPGDPSIYDELLRCLSIYNTNGWVVSSCINESEVVSALHKGTGWRKESNFEQLFSDEDFLLNAGKTVYDVTDISFYHGFLFATSPELINYKNFEAQYPGVVVIDKSSFPFWIDKFKIAELFAQNELLSTFKPKWGLYKQKYSKNLANQIISDLQCDAFVIKPRGEFLGNGVIIVQKENLDATLKYILIKSEKLRMDPDPAYSHWNQDRFDTFLVEEFIASDLITFPHLENKAYQPTMRVVFLLVYNKYCHDVHFLGSFWKTPERSIHEEGDFMRKNKSSPDFAIRCPVDPEIMEKVKDELRIALPLFHMQMLMNLSR